MSPGVGSDEGFAEAGYGNVGNGTQGPSAEVVSSQVISSEGFEAESSEADGPAEAAADVGGRQPVFVEWTAASRTGSITVRTTEYGLPLGISVDAAELKRDPKALATE